MKPCFNLLLIVIMLFSRSSPTKTPITFSTYFALPLTDSSTVYYHYIYQDIERVSSDDSAIYIQKLLHYVSECASAYTPVKQISIINDISDQEPTLEDFHYNEATTATIFKVSFDRDSLSHDRYVVKEVYKR